MDLRFSEAEDRFRGEVKTFLDGELPKGWPEAHSEKEREQFAKGFRKKLAAKGWLTLAWPKEYGGQARTVTEQLVYNEEMSSRRAPSGGGMGVAWVGPLVMLYGTEEQKQAFIPPIVKDEVNWCTLYSEPGAGSDLAGLQTQAVLQGDEFIVNGQKIWTTGGHQAHWGLLAARTDPNAEKHKGISMILVDMKTPGVKVSPLWDLTGEHHFNQVFFDNVRVPRKNLIGQLHRGWYQMAVGLQFERSWINQVIMAQRFIDDLVRYAKANGAGTDWTMRQKIADMAVRNRVGRMLGYRVVWIQSTGGSPSYESSVDKLFTSENLQRFSGVGMQMLGLKGQLNKSDSRAPLRGEVQHNLRQWVGWTIAGGTTEIQRSIIATRGLGLPR
ncbi:MAG: acyl-CoA dehydrogenase family protein [Chloroflexi bacterium]|nr:acyl-CoA dehydrogenase family protein [Chloroflexota bacterium]